MMFIFIFGEFNHETIWFVTKKTFISTDSVLYNIYMIRFSSSLLVIPACCLECAQFL